MKKSSALLACFALAFKVPVPLRLRDTSLKAQLDFEKLNYIYLPLDEYDMSDQAEDYKHIGP